MKKAVPKRKSIKSVLMKLDDFFLQKKSSGGTFFSRKKTFILNSFFFFFSKSIATFLFPIQTCKIFGNGWRKRSWKDFASISSFFNAVECRLITFFLALLYFAKMNIFASISPRPPSCTLKTLQITSIILYFTGED